MNKILEVKEFDMITCHRDYQHHKKYKYLEEKTFRELISFIHDYRHSGNGADILDFMKIIYQRHFGEIISIQNFVGIIELKSGFQIQILPKISFDTDDEDNKLTRAIFIRMLKSMKNFPGKDFQDANLKTAAMNIYEIFISMYLQQVTSLVKRGIQSDYLNREENQHYYKGKLLMNKHIIHNLVHKERFYISYDEFLPDRPENRIIKATLLKLQKVSSHTENMKKIKQLLNAFDMVQPSFHYVQDFARVQINRHTKSYEAIIQWSKIFLCNQSFTVFSGDNKAKALLFPMETVYESYVAKKIKAALGPSGWEISLQDQGHYLFDMPDHKFALRPDIVCRKGHRTIIMDTKWKSLINDERANYGIKQEDMYQMYAYSKKYHAHEIWLLYPMNQAMKNHAPIYFDSGDGTLVKVYFIDLAHIEQTMINLQQQIENA